MEDNKIMFFNHDVHFLTILDSFDISAGHLIAMTPNSEDSILLLDDRGCPTNVNVFPALTKTSENSVKRLSAVFQAFKFSTSPIIRFSVMVMFCQYECPIVSRLFHFQTHLASLSCCFHRWIAAIITITE